MKTTIDIQALSAFVAVARLGSFTKAGEFLDTQKATLSRTVARLENELGVRLLQRTTRAVSLTEAGRELFERATHVLSALDDAKAAMERTQSEPTGRLTLTCGEEFGQLVVSGWITAFLARYRRVSVRAELTNRVVDLIHEGFDLAIRIGALTDSSLSARKLGDVTYGLYASPAYVDRGRMPKSPADLARHDLIAFSPSGPASWRLVRGAETHTFEPSARVVTTSNLMARNAAAGGLGIALLPDFQAKKLQAERRLLRVLPTWSRTPVPVHAVFASSRYLSPKVRAFVDLARESWLSGIDVCSNGS